MRGRVDSLTWKLPDDLSEDEWIEAGIILAKIGAGVTWWVGDYWIYGDKKYGDRKAIVDDPNWRGPSFQTCANAASVCRAFETSRRREVLLGIAEVPAGREASRSAPGLGTSHDRDHRRSDRESEGNTGRSMTPRADRIRGSDRSGWRRFGRKLGTAGRVATPGLPNSNTA